MALPNHNHMRGVPLNGMREVDPRAFIERYVQDRKHSVPLVPIIRTFRARTLETTGLHHNWWGDEEWARRVKAVEAKRQQALKLGELKARAEEMAVQAKIKADGVQL